MRDSSQETVLVLGARGRLGTAAVRAFAAQGWRVLAQVRPGTQGEAINGVTWLPVAVHDTPALTQAARGAAGVVHALNPPYPAWDRLAVPLLDAGMRVARSLGARLLLPGNVYNFGASMPALLTEDTPQLADTRKGQVRVRMEQTLRDAAQAGDLRSVVIRAGDFFGSGTGGWFDRALVRDITRGKVTYPGPLHVPTAWAYLPDLAETFVRVSRRLCAADDAAAAFDVFHFQGQSLTGQQWINLLDATARDQRWIGDDEDLRVASLPWKWMRWGSAARPMWRELVEMQYLWNTPHALAGAKLAALIGPEPRTALPAALGRSLHSLGLVGASQCPLQAWA
ncbi:MAG: NAD-dependent epimerase/dehydratase family protein [Burkholderiaceae bacterium]